MSADNIKKYSAEGYNWYVLNTGAKKYAIGGVPERYAGEYIKSAAAADAAILLTANPEFSGGLAALLEIKPDMEIYGGSAALRNIKEILNRSVNERLIKDDMTENGLRFLITPGLHWVDTIMAEYGGALFSGQLFSGGAEAESYYNERLAVNRGFVADALERLCNADISVILPAYGGEARADIIKKYRRYAAKEDKKRLAVIIYSSRFGYTKELAEHLKNALGKTCAVEIYDAEKTERAVLTAAINTADMLAVGTRTSDRNAPRCIWDAITGIDLMNRRGRPYFVFGSFAWAGDGIRLIDRTLTAMGMRQAAKPVDVLLKPTYADMERMDKAVKALLSLPPHKSSAGSQADPA